MKIADLIDKLRETYERFGDLEVAFTAEVHYEEIPKSCYQDMIWRTPKDVLVSPMHIQPGDGPTNRAVIRIYTGDFTDDPYQIVKS